MFQFRLQTDHTKSGEPGVCLQGPSLFETDEQGFVVGNFLWREVAAGPPQIARDETPAEMWHS